MKNSHLKIEGIGMGRGSRPSAEFIDGTPRRQLPLRRTPQKPDDTRAPHIDMRVRRKVALSDKSVSAEDLYYWHDFLAKAGSENEAIGMARSIGSVGITYFGSTDLNNMLRERYSRDYFDPQRKLRLFRNIGSGITAFMRDQVRQAKHEICKADERAVQMAMAGNMPPVDESWIFQDATDDFSSDEIEASTVEIQKSEYLFGPATLMVKGVKLYGHRASLDLSNNERTYEEHNRLDMHLRHEEKLDTRIIGRTWRAHATFFDVLPHLPPTPFETPFVPDEIVFNSPNVSRTPQ